MSGANFNNADYGVNNNANNPNNSNHHTAEQTYDFEPLPFNLSATQPAAEHSFPNDALAGQQETAPTLSLSVLILEELVKIIVVMKEGQGKRDQRFDESVKQFKVEFATALKLFYELDAFLQSGLAAKNPAPQQHYKKRPAPNDDDPVRPSPTFQTLLERLSS